MLHNITVSSIMFVLECNQWCYGVRHTTRTVYHKSCARCMIFHQKHPYNKYKFITGFVFTTHYTGYPNKMLTPFVSIPNMIINTCYSICVQSRCQAVYLVKIHYSCRKVASFKKLTIWKSAWSSPMCFTTQKTNSKSLICTFQWRNQTKHNFKLNL